MVLLLDNYDSFVYNLARYIGLLGYEYVVYRNDALTLAHILALAPTHIVISPGPGKPNEAGITLEVIKTYGQKIPILGVCLGHQAIGQAFGGEVARAIKPMHGKSCHIQHNGQDIFTGLPNPLTVARYHSLIVVPKNLPEDLEVTAFSKENEIMALKHKNYPIFGVQFHPESVLTNHGYQLIKNFVTIQHIR